MLKFKVHRFGRFDNVFAVSALLKNQRLSNLSKPLRNLNGKETTKFLPQNRIVTIRDDRGLERVFLRANDLLL